MNGYRRIKLLHVNYSDLGNTEKLADANHIPREMTLLFLYYDDAVKFARVDQPPEVEETYRRESDRKIIPPPRRYEVADKIFELEALQARL